jgi:hypothetical protein
VTNPTPPEYWDDLVRVVVEPPTESRGTIHLAAAGAGVACSVELSATGAGVADLLRTAATEAAARLVDLELGIDEDGQT